MRFEGIKGGWGYGLLFSFGFCFYMMFLRGELAVPRTIICFLVLEPFVLHGVSLFTSAEGPGATVARRVKTVNIQPGRKTVGHGCDRYRLRWIMGIGAFLVHAQPW